MKKFLDKYPVVRIILGVALLILGVIFIIVTAVTENTADITKIFCIIFGAYCILGATIGLVISYVFEVKGKTLVNALPYALTLGVGIAFIVISGTTVVPQVIETFVPIMALAAGGAYLIQTLIEIISKFAVKTWLSRLAIGLVLLACGIVLMVIGNNSVQKLIYFVLGIGVTVIGIVTIVFGSVYIYNEKKADKDKKEEPKEEDK